MKNSSIFSYSFYLFFQKEIRVGLVNRKQFYRKIEVKIAISFLMEHTYQYAWVIPLLPLPVIMSMGFGLILIPTATKNLRRIWAFPSVLLLSIAMVFSVQLSIQQINGSSIYQYLWSWTVNNDFSLEFGYLIDPLTSIMLILITTVGILVLIYSDVAKSAQFPLHVWLPDAMEGPTPISALIHAATMVAAGIFLLARLLPLFISLPLIMSFISLVGTITLFLGATLALAQRDIKRSLAYSTMSQLGYMMLALGMGSYRAALFHLITHAYSKALLFLGSGSVIHSMEPLVGYSPDKSQNMVLMGGLRKYIPITRTTFLWGTLSLCGIPPLACFWSKDEILSNSWLYSPFFGIIASFTAGLTAFYMFRIYLLTFGGYLRVHFQNYSSTKESSLYSISLWGKRIPKGVNRDFVLSTTKSGVSFFSQNIPKIQGISFDNGGMDNGIAELTILSKWLTPSKNFTQESSNSFLSLVYS
ncbi:NADH-plastoquinone oxidoreductase subunit 5 [Medicago truncatula]|uniref:NAD(P)H-quinone oxidoreductase subunit 5, chloroplastic n=1 Tax=Medicago truncatula TaxID=3880 RepID=A0A072TLF2_MEDTR|nr:NADH-plastoquinone oxidoreductase subunit 5 [Medicago truncatula]